MPYCEGSVLICCPNCLKRYHRVYREYDNGFGFCRYPTCKNIKLVRASTFQNDRKLAAKQEKIRQELAGIQHVRARNTSRSLST